MLKKISAFFLVLFVLLTALTANALTPKEPIWYEKDAYNEPVIHLYFFWSEKCPHCLKARPDIAALAKEYSWLKLHSLELVRYPDNVQTFINMSAMFDDAASSVPAFMFCGNMINGYESKVTTGRFLKDNLRACYQFAKRSDPDNKTAFILSSKVLSSVDLPLFGEITSSDYSLPVLTVFIAGMDAFNPCAFFVLLFLLSMMVHGRSRSRMAIIGGIFVFFSGAIYFLFMTAWLNLFIYAGELRLITLIAGSIAVVIAAINIKDYFWFKKGFSLGISDNEKPRLFDRVRRLLRLDSIVAVVIATVVLAIVANSYELLCTAGFPMVYTRILTLNSLSIESYYMYILLYSFIYILPLLVIVSVFTIKLGSRKLSEYEGMVLKLLSGVMMLILGLLLVLSPHLLNSIFVAAAIVFVSVGVTWVTVRSAAIKKDTD
jgi:thiol-disulfide isomerase/thioredoxin